MPRLPDIPVQSWLDDQVERFQQGTSGHLDSLFFEDQARQQEAMIPPDFDAPGGMDQWEQAAQDKRVEELRRQQEEDERRIQEQQAQASQAAQAQQEQTQAQQTQQAGGFLSSLGIPTPEEAFSTIQGWWNKPADHVSSSGVFDGVPSGPSEPAPSPTPSPEPAPTSSPAGDFLSWSKDLTGSLLGSPDTSSTTPEGGSAALPPTEPPSADSSSTTGIFDRLGEGIQTVGSAVDQGLRTAQDSMHRGAAAAGEYIESFQDDPTYQTAVRYGMPNFARDIPGTVRGADYLIQNYGAGKFSRDIERTQELETEQQAFLGDRATTRSRLAGDVDPAWAEANPEKAEELRRLQEDFAMTVGGMAGATNFGMRSQAVDAIKALKAARMGEDIILAAERELASRTNSTLAGIQELTRGKKVADATREAESLRDQGVTSHPDYLAHDPAIEAARVQEDATFTAMREAEMRHGEESPEFRSAENEWLKASGAHADANLAQEAVRQRLLQDLPGVEAPAAPVSQPTVRQAQKAFNATEEIYATAVTAERNAARRFGPGSEEHAAALEDLEFVGGQLERRRTALAEAQGKPLEPRDPGGETTNLVAEAPTSGERVPDAESTGGRSVPVDDPSLASPSSVSTPGRTGPLELGQPVTTPDGRTGTVGGRTRITVEGETRNEVIVYHPNGDTSRHVPEDIRAAGPVPSPEERLARAVATPTPQEAALPRVLPNPPDPTGPPRPGSRVPPPEVVEAADRDAAKVGEMLDRTRGRAGSAAARPDDVKKVMNWIESTKNSTTDRRARLAAGERYIERLRGGKPLDPGERAWLLSRIYEGREDAALARMERMLQAPLTRVGVDHLPELEKVAIQLDNVGKDWLARTKEENRVLRTIPDVRARQTAPVNEIRREGEAALEKQRAQANLKSTEKEWIEARKEGDALRAEMDKAGEGPSRVSKQRTRIDKTTRKRVKETTEDMLTTEDEMRLQDRLEQNTIRQETAKARHADARRSLEEAIAGRMDRAEARTRARASERSDQIGDARKYSGGATVQDVDGVLAALVKRVGPKKATEITDGLDALYRYRDASRERLVESGIWDKATGDAFKDLHPYYVPTKIMEKLDDSFLANLPTGARTFSSRSDLIKHLTPQGTEADRMTPIRSILEMGFQAEAASRRNEVMRAVAGWSDTPGMENFVRKLNSNDAAPHGWKKMSAMIDGKAQNIAVIEPVADSLELAPPGAAGLWGAVLKGASAPLRAGATALRPAFIATNAVNDAVLTLFRFAAEKPWYDLPNPVSRLRDLTDLFKGYHTAFGAANSVTQAGAGGLLGAQATTMGLASQGDYPWNDPDYWKKVGAGATTGAALGMTRKLAPVDRAMIQRFRESGASMGMDSRFRAPDDIARQLAGEHVFVRTLTKEGDLKDVLANQAGRIGDALGLLWERPLAEIGKVIESAPRYAAFGRAERETSNLIAKELAAARKQGHVITPEQEADLRAVLMKEQEPEIANKARRVTVDFAAGGSFIKAANQLSPFLNASTQALVESADMLQKNPGGVAAATAAIILATALAEIHNRSVAPEDYKNISDFTKNTGIILLSDKEPEGEGKRGLLYIPARGGPGALVPLTKAAMGIMFGDDPRTWQKLALDTGLATVNQMSPINTDPGSLVSSFTPPILSLMGQAQANYDVFRDQPIISRSMESLPKSEQYDDRTSLFARHMARSGLKAFSSPMMTDWFLKNASPGPSEAFLSVADNIIKSPVGDLMGLEDLPDVTRDVPKGVRDVPMFGQISGRFLRTVGSAEQNRAYEIADEIAGREMLPAVKMLQNDPMYQKATPDRQKALMRILYNDIQDKAQTLAGVEKKTPDVGQPIRWAGVQPGSALEQEIVHAIGTDATKRTYRQKTLAGYYDGKDTPAYTQWRKRQTRESDRVREMVR